jgi:hypothetical protein
MNLRLSILFLLIAILGGCLHRGLAKPQTLDQSTPKAGLLAYYEAVASGDPACVRQCMYFTPAHARFAEDQAELAAVSARFHHVISAHFPGHDHDLFWETYTDSALDEARRGLPQATLTVHGDHAIIKGIPAKRGVTWQLANMECQLRNDRGHWKIDGEATPNIDNYPPKMGTDDVVMGMMYYLHDSCPILRLITADVEAGRLKSIEQVKQAMKERSEGLEQKSRDKLANEPVNRGNPATHPESMERGS